MGVGGQTLARVDRAVTLFLEDAQCFSSISELSSEIEKLVSFYSDTA